MSHTMQVHDANHRTFMELSSACNTMHMLRRRMSKSHMYANACIFLTIAFTCIHMCHVCALMFTYMYVYMCVRLHVFVYVYYYYYY